VNISLSSTAPTGATYYVRLGSFYNDASGNIAWVKNDNDYFQDVKAYVHFNGTGTPAIRQARNVTSVSDDATGTHTITFGTAMADANYVTLCSAHDNYQGNSSDPDMCAAYYTATGSVKISIRDDENELKDCESINVAIIGR